MKKPSSLKNQSGFILISTYFVVTLISIFSLAYFARSNAFLQATERNRNKIIAFNMAEAGVDFTTSQLSLDPSYTGTPAYVSMGTNFIGGGFTTTVTKVPDDPMIRIIQATGFSPDNTPTSRAFQAANITAYGEFTPDPLFNFAIFATNSITLTSSGQTASVDSYDSRLGPYNGNGAGNEGDIGTNSIVSAAIRLTGNTIVQGDALVGPGGDPAAAISLGPNATITGAQGASPNLHTYATPSTNIPSSGALSISGGTQTLMPGTYHYSSLDISGQGRLDATGPVTIYVDGSVNITGQGITTQNNLPPNLMIYVIGSEPVKIAGLGAFYGGIYAPNSLVKNDGNAGLFGAVISKNYQQTGNSAIHFDVALKDIQGNPNLGDLHIKTWQEQNSLTWET